MKRVSGKNEIFSGRTIHMQPNVPQYGMGAPVYGSPYQQQQYPGWGNPPPQNPNPMYRQQSQPPPMDFMDLTAAPAQSPGPAHPPQQKIDTRAFRAELESESDESRLSKYMTPKTPIAPNQQATPIQQTGYNAPQNYYPPQQAYGGQGFSNPAQNGYGAQQYPQQQQMYGAPQQYPNPNQQGMFNYQQQAQYNAQAQAPPAPAKQEPPTPQKPKNILDDEFAFEITAPKPVPQEPPKQPSAPASQGSSTAMMFNSPNLSPQSMPTPQFDDFGLPTVAHPIETAPSQPAFDDFGLPVAPQTQNQQPNQPSFPQQQQGYGFNQQSGYATQPTGSSFGINPAPPQQLTPAPNQEFALPSQTFAQSPQQPTYPSGQQGFGFGQEANQFPDPSFRPTPQQTSSQSGFDLSLSTQTQKTSSQSGFGPPSTQTQQSNNFGFPQESIQQNQGFGLAPPPSTSNKGFGLAPPSSSTQPQGFNRPPPKQRQGFELAPPGSQLPGFGFAQSSDNERQMPPQQSDQYGFPQGFAPEPQQQQGQQFDEYGNPAPPEDQYQYNGDESPPRHHRRRKKKVNREEDDPGQQNTGFVNNQYPSSPQSNLFGTAPPLANITDKPFDPFSSQESQPQKEFVKQPEFNPFGEAPPMPNIPDKPFDPFATQQAPPFDPFGASNESPQPIQPLVEQTQVQPPIQQQPPEPKKPNLRSFDMFRFDDDAKEDETPKDSTMTPELSSQPESSADAFPKPNFDSPPALNNSRFAFPKPENPVTPNNELGFGQQASQPNQFDFPAFDTSKAAPEQSQPKSNGFDFPAFDSPKQTPQAQSTGFDFPAFDQTPKQTSNTSNAFGLSMPKPAPQADSFGFPAFDSKPAPIGVPPPLGGLNTRPPRRTKRDPSAPIVIKANNISSQLVAPASSGLDLLDFSSMPTNTTSSKPNSSSFNGFNTAPAPSSSSNNAENFSADFLFSSQIDSAALAPEPVFTSSNSMSNNQDAFMMPSAQKATTQAQNNTNIPSQSYSAPPAINRPPPDNEKPVPLHIYNKKNEVQNPLDEPIKTPETYKFSFTKEETEASEIKLKIKLPPLPTTYSPEPEHFSNAEYDPNLMESDENPATSEIVQSVLYNTNTFGVDDVLKPLAKPNNRIDYIASNPLPLPKAEDVKQMPLYEAFTTYCSQSMM